MSSIIDRKNEVLKKFKGLEEWEDRYRLVVHYGKKLAPMDDALKSEDTKIRGCLSQVWLAKNKQEDLLIFQADSDSAIVKGIIGILVFVYSNATAKEILELPADFLKEVGIDQHLSLSRRNGLANMCRMLFEYAQQEST